MSLPVPPPAYWDSVPWWAYMGVLLIIAGLASPFATQLLRGRTGAYQAREQAFVARQAALDGRENAYVARLEASETAAREGRERDRLASEAERAALAEDRDEGWDRARGMEDVAHTMRHELAGMCARFNALMGLFADLMRGRMAPERAEALFAQIKPAEEPAPVPALRDIARKQSADGDHA